MKLQLVEGCVYDSLTVDGKEEIDLTGTERQRAINKIADWLKRHPEDLNYLLQDLVPRYGEYESDDVPCECCGDTVTTYTWDI